MSVDSPEKRTHATLFQSFELLHRRRLNEFHLVVIGDGPQRNELRKLQRNSCRNIISGLHIAQTLPNSPVYYRAADLFVHPGVQETFGLAALESQACGTPVVGIRGSYMDRDHLSRSGIVGAGKQPGSACRLRSKSSARRNCQRWAGPPRVDSGKTL